MALLHLHPHPSALTHQSRVRALQTENSENDERYRRYHDVKREVSHEVLRRPVIHINHNHFDRLR